MRSRTLLILLMLGIAFTQCRRITKDDLTESQDFFRSVPDDEKEDFLAYALGHEWMEQSKICNTKRFPFPRLLDLPPHLERKFKNIDMPKNFTSDLYRFVKITFRLSTARMFELARRRKICFPNGKCIDFDNIGQLCCPF